MTIISQITLKILNKLSILYYYYYYIGQYRYKFILICQLKIFSENQIYKLLFLNLYRVRKIFIIKGNIK